LLIIFLNRSFFQLNQRQGLIHENGPYAGLGDRAVSKVETEKTPLERTAMVRVVIGAVIISFSPVLFKISGASPSAGSFYRTLIGGVFLLLIAFLRRERPLSVFISSRALPLIFLCSLLFFLDLEFWHFSINYIGPGLATIIANFQAIILAVLGVVFFSERFTLRLAASIVFSFVGLWFLVGVDLSALPPEIATGVAWALGAALWYALFILGVRSSQARSWKLPAVTNMAWISLGTAFFVGFFALLRGVDFKMGGTAGAVALFIYGIGPQAIGWLFISTGLPKFRASVAGLIMLIQPTLAFIWDILIFSRPSGLINIFGAILALCAIYIGSAGKKKR